MIDVARLKLILILIRETQDHPLSNDAMQQQDQHIDSGSQRATLRVEKTQKKLSDLHAGKKSPESVNDSQVRR